MGTVNLSTKPNGSTNWVDGDTVNGAGLSADMNTIYNEFNGQIDNANVKPAAAIVATKLAAGTITNTQISAAADIDPGSINDYSASGAEVNSISNPGTSAANTPAVTLEKELEQLRYVLRRAALGANARITNGTSSGLKADGNAAWFDSSVIGESVIRNGAFLDATANGTANPPYGWTTVQTPSTLARVALDAAEGKGEAIHIVDDGGADCGISQTLAGLRASSLYLVVARMKPITTTFKLETTGATGTFGNLAIVSTSGGSVWQTLSGVISTDGAPTNVVVSLVATVANAACHVASIDCYPLGDDRRERHRPFYASRTVVTDGGGNLTIAQLESGTTTPMVVPGPGYTFRVSGLIAVASTGSSTGIIQRSIDGGAFSDMRLGTVTSGGSEFDWCEMWYDEDPSSIGSVYQFRLSASFLSGSLNRPAGTASVIRVELVKN